MNDRFLIGFYWGSRKLNIEQSASFAVDVLFLLKPYLNISTLTLTTARSTDLEFNICNESGKFVKEIIAERILKDRLPDIKRYHEDIVPSIHFEEPVGFSFSILSYGKAGYRYNFSFSIGQFNTTGSNVFLLEYPFHLINLQFENVHRWFVSLNQMIKPQYSFVSSKTIQKQQQLPEYFFGWMNFFSREIYLPAIPSEYEMEEVDNRGKLLITTREDFDAVNNPEHFQKAMKLVNLFREYNIVRPQ